MPGFPVHYQLRVYSNSCPSSQWCHPIVSSSVNPFCSYFQSFPASGSFPMSQFMHQVAKVLEFQLQPQSFQWIFRADFLENWLVGSPCFPRDSQESSPTLHFKSISSSVLSFLYGSTLTSIHDYWKNHSFVNREIKAGGWKWRRNSQFLRSTDELH